jgi:hypothetical protein
MPRHRAPSTQSRALANLTISGALTGAALGASVLSPVAASAATSQSDQVTRHSHGSHHRDRDRNRDRPMTSGERQYRNGCRQGYISEDCEQFSVTSLLRRGIDPFR